MALHPHLDSHICSGLTEMHSGLLANILKVKYSCCCLFHTSLAHPLLEFRVQVIKEEEDYIKKIGVGGICKVLEAK